MIHTWLPLKRFISTLECTRHCKMQMESKHKNKWSESLIGYYYCKDRIIKSRQLHDRKQSPDLIGNAWIIKRAREREREREREKKGKTVLDTFRGLFKQWQIVGQKPQHIDKCVTCSCIQHLEASLSTMDKHGAMMRQSAQRGLI